MTLKSFDEYLRTGVIKKQSINKQRALALIKEAEEKKKFLEISIKNIPKEQMNHNFIAETCYDITMELIRAKMLIDGYNTSSSHEAEVSYLEKLGFQYPEIRFMDELRYFRNGIKYYGTMINKEYSDKTLTFLEKTYKKLKKLLGINS